MVSTKDLVVGVDMATAAVRAVSVDGEGNVHASASSPLPAPRSNGAGEVEQDARAWAPTVLAVLRQLTEQLGARRDAVSALSVCATSGTVVAVDGEGEPVGPALMYSDQRARREAEDAQVAASARWGSLGLRVQPSFGLPKWGWLVRHADPGVGLAGLAHASDVVVGRLIGGAAPTDWSSALKSGYDPLRLEWASEALDALGIPRALVPDVLPPATAVGSVCAAAAEATGLPRRCEVRLGMTDACAAQLAAGAGSPGHFVSVLGTTLAVKGASHDLVADPAGAVYSHRHPGGWWLPGGASSTGGAALAAAGFAERDVADLDRRAAGHGPAGVVTYPLAGRGERFPFVAADAEGFVVGKPAGDVERYRSILEGVAFVERLAYERLARLGARPEAPRSASGAGSGSRAWTRIRATVLGAPLVARPSATTARGACILAAAGTLHADVSSAAEAMAVEGEVVEPVAGERDALEASYRRFVLELQERGWLAI